MIKYKFPAWVVKVKIVLISFFRMALKLVLLLIILFIILVGVFNFGGGNMSSQTPEEKIVMVNNMIRDHDLSLFERLIEDYYTKNKKYPRYLTEIIEIVPIDPITGQIDWEVCDYKNKNVWYRTSNNVYDPNLKLWNPAPDSGIFQVRPHILPDSDRAAWLTNFIEKYRLKNNKYPRYLTDVDAAFPIDPATGYADWEVCDYKNKNVWYRTSNIDYDSHIKLWNPAPEDSFCKVRSRTIPQIHKRRGEFVF